MGINNEKLQKLALRRVEDLVNTATANIVTLSVSDTRNQPPPERPGSISDEGTLARSVYEPLNEAQQWLRALTGRE